jgi:hypothetical protein
MLAHASSVVITRGRPSMHALALATTSTAPFIYLFVLIRYQECVQRLPLPFRLAGGPCSLLVGCPQMGLSLLSRTSSCQLGPALLVGCPRMLFSLLSRACGCQPVP